MKLQGDQWMAPGFDRPDDRLPAFVPGWKPGATGPARAILEIAARYASLLGERLSKAVDKAKLAFLEALGVDVIPAQPARCPVVF